MVGAGVFLTEFDTFFYDIIFYSVHLLSKELYRCNIWTC